jgi:hypothetical protein
MKHFTIYIRTGGLMEDPDFHWERHGSAAGVDEKDACINHFKDDKLFNAKRTI